MPISYRARSGKSAMAQTRTSFDPSKSPLSIRGPGGMRCVIRAWRDPLVAGLILYDIICCVNQRPEEATTELAIPELVALSPPFDEVRDNIQKIIDDRLPIAIKGQAQALLVPESVFELMVKPRLAAALDATLDKVAVQLGEAHRRRMAELLTVTLPVTALPLVVGNRYNSLSPRRRGYWLKQYWS